MYHQTKFELILSKIKILVRKNCSKLKIIIYIIEVIKWLTNIYKYICPKVVVECSRITIICSYTEVGYTNVNFISCRNSNRLVKMFSKNECIPPFPRILVSKSRKLSMEYLTSRIYLEDKVSSMSIYITLLIIECYL